MTTTQGGIHLGGYPVPGFHLGGAGLSLGTSSGGTGDLAIGTSAVTLGTDKRLLFDDAGLVGEATLTWNKANSQLLFPTLGTAALPSSSFAGDPNTGVWSPGADRLGFATGGVARWEVALAGHLLAAADNTFDIGASGATRPKDLHLSGVALVGDGSAAAPSFAFDSAGTGGMYKPGTGRLGFSTGGVARWEMSAAGHLIAATDATFDIGLTGATRPRDAFLSGHVLTGAGAAATPAHAFDADADTGLWSPGANRLGFATAGVARWEMDASGNFIATTDNALDIGATGATRPRIVYAADNFNAQTNLKGLLLFNGHQIRSNSALIEINAGNTVTDSMVKLQGRLQAGTTTATSADILLNSLVTRTAGWIAQIQNNTVSKMSVKYDGRLFLTVPNSAPTDADLLASQVTFYLVEGSNTLQARVKYSDGTTLKSLTVALALS
jgi:hypothetical protein